MKNLLLTIAAAALLLLTSCQRDELQGGSISGEEVTVSISAVVPGDGGAVVKSNDNPGNGSEVNRCILEVYLLKGEDESATASLYGTRHIVKMQDKKASFEDLNLITGQKYRFVLWADHVDDPDTEAGLAVDKFYETDDLQTVTMVTEKSYAGNEDKRDAFFYRSDNAVTVDGPADYTLQLKRPFGQLNIITTDYGLIPETHKDLRPAKVQLAYKSIPTGINLLTGELLSTDESVTVQKVEGQAVPITDLSVAGNEDARQLSFDYIFAPATGQHIIGELTMSFLQEDGTTPTGISDYTIESLPVQRNYRTNVSGALLTDRAGLSIEVKPDFDETVTVAEQAETIEAAQLAINAGMTDIEFTKVVNGTIMLPEGNKNYRIAFNEGTDGAITIKASDFTGNVEVENNGSSGNGLTISLKEGSATVGNGSWSSIQVKTGNGFTLGEDAVVNSFVWNGGDIEIYGEIANLLQDFSLGNGQVKVFTTYNVELLKDALALLASDKCEKIVLGDDIAITPPNTYQIKGSGSHVIDLAGNKLAIKEFKANVMDVSDGAALTIQNGVISNDFTLGTNEVTIAAFVTGNHGSIEIDSVEFTTVATGAMIKEGAKQANLTIRKSTIHSTKNGYAVGTNASSPTSDVVVTLENSTLKSDYGCAVLFNINGKINVSGSDIIGGNQGLILRGGTGILSDSEVSLNCIEQNASQYANFMHNRDWASGSNVPFAAITAGNRGAGYEYPTNLTLKNCEVKSIGDNADMFPAMYVWGNSAENNVAITHTNTTFNGKVIYGEDGANITVNEQPASQLTE